MIKTTYSLSAGYLLHTFSALFLSVRATSQQCGPGFEISGGQRLDAALHDILNMTDIYLPLVSVSLANRPAGCFCGHPQNRTCARWVMCLPALSP